MGQTLAMSLPPKRTVDFLAHLHYCILLASSTNLGTEHGLSQNEKTLNLDTGISHDMSVRGA